MGTKAYKLAVITLTVALAAFLILHATSFASKGTITLNGPVSTKESKEAEKAWQKIRPSIELFWKQAEESPTLLAQAAWPVIRKLRRYIRQFPDSPHVPQAYYLIGHAYAQISYMPEALAHWRIVANLYPKSEWASEALMAILQYQEMTGELGRMVPFYKKIVSQYPDTVAAKAAWIALAIDALNQGNVKWVAQQTAKLEQSFPNLYLEIPRLLDLKARIAMAQHNTDKAQEYWLHYLNLIQQPYQKAAALFHIAESLKRGGEFLAARKYYAVIVRDYPFSAESLFARFRLAQLKEMERRRLAEYIPSIMKIARPDPMTGRIMETILKRYPKHPLAKEVFLELARYRYREMEWAFSKGDYKKAFQIALAFAERFPDTPSAGKVKEKLLALETQLLADETPLPLLQEIASKGAAFLAEHPDNSFDSALRPLVGEIWIEAMKRMGDEGKYQDALAQFWSYRSALPGYQPKRSVALGRRLLLGMDRLLLSKNEPAQLIDYHYAHENEIEHLETPVHLSLVGRAWQVLNCPRAAERAFYSAWKMGGINMGADGLIWWCQSLVSRGDIAGASLVRSLASSLEFDASHRLSLALLEADIAAGKHEWEKVLAKLEPIQEKLKGREKERAEELLFNAYVELGQWNSAGMIWSAIEPRLPEKKKIAMMTEWGDRALELGFGDEALSVYKQLVEMTQAAPPYLWRIAKAKTMLGQRDAEEVWKAVAASGTSPWSDGARAMLANQNFWQGPAAAFASMLNSSEAPQGNEETGPRTNE